MVSGNTTPKGIRLRRRRFALTHAATSFYAVRRCVAGSARLGIRFAPLSLMHARELIELAGLVSAMGRC